MALSVQATLFSRVQFPDGPKTYYRELPDDRMLFTGESGEFEIRAKDYARGLSQGELQVLSAPGEEPEGPPQTIGAVVPPNTSEEKLLEAKTRLFYVNKCDLEGIGDNRGKRLERLLRGAKDKAHALGLTANVTPRMLSADLKKGAPGSRFLSLYVSLRGKCGGRSPHPLVKKFTQYAASYYWSEKKPTVNQCFDRLQELLKDENDRRKKDNIRERLEVYSDSTLRRYIHAMRNYDNVRTRDGKITADLTFRGSETTRRGESPLDVVQIDHTVLDVHIVDERSGHVLGRPILSIAICSYSRCIVGYIVSFEPPSLSKLAALLKNIVFDKYHYRDLVPGIPRDIEEYGLPGTIVLDRSLENLSGGLKEMCKGIGIDIEWAPSKNGASKVDVERSFGILNQKVVHHLPGSVAHTVSEMRRLQVNPVKFASLTMSALDKVLINTFVDYQHSPHRPLHEVPAEKFKKGLSIRPRKLPHNNGILDDLFLLRGKAKLWNKGIEFKGLLYRNSSATTGLLDAQLGKQAPKSKTSLSRKNNNIIVDVLYNPENCSEISVVGEIDGKIMHFRFPCTFSEYTIGLSFLEHKAVNGLVKKRAADKKNEADLLSARRDLAELVHAYHLLNTKDRSAEGRQIIERLERRDAELRRENQRKWDELADRRRRQARTDAVIVDSPMSSGPLGEVEPPAAPRGRAKAAKTKKTNDAARATVQRTTKGTDPQPLLFDDDEIMPSFLNRKAKS